MKVKIPNQVSDGFEHVNLYNLNEFEFVAF